MPSDYAGEIYASAFDRIGKNISDAIQIYQQRKRSQEMAAGQLEMARAVMIPGPQGKPIPLIDQKSYEAMSNYLQRHRDVGAAVVQNQMQMLGAIAMEGAKARIKAESTPFREFRDSFGNLVYENRSGVHVLKQSGPASSQKPVLEAPARKILGGLGITPEEFETRDQEEQGFVDPTGKGAPFTKPEKGFDPKKYNSVQFRTGGNRTHVLPLNQFDTLEKTYPRKGDPDFTPAPDQGKHSDRATAIQKMYRDGKLTRDAAIKALQDLNEGYK